ncbi:hypothetical protein AYI69_g9224 [Smittium culicis]|uniref:Uncharacterized protein n=1 Tax=Smittium culicis TaxID=133412 RepID=A0A1R1XE31_9FUNG|nr:hypothetical protein AYI69_g9224 [Smittium culicis]
MRTMLADLASTITQSRIDNLHKKMVLPGRTPQLIESKIKPLIANDQLETMIAANKTVRKSRKKRKGPFHQRQQPGNIYYPAAAPVQQAAPAQNQSNTSHNQGGGDQSHNERSSISLVKESHRGSEGQEPGILQQPVYDSKEDGRPPPSLRSPEPQQSCGGTLIQDGNIDVHMQDDQEQGLHGVPGLGRRLHACVPITSPPVWTLSEPSYLYQGTQTSPNLGQNSGHTSLSILGRPFDNMGVQGEVYGKHSNIVFPAYQTGIQNQFEEVDPDSFPINNSLGDGDKFQNDEPEDPQGQDQRFPKSSSHVGSSSPRTPYVEKAIGAEEKRAEEFEFMDISGDAEQICVTEPEILVPKTQEMERAMISAGDPRAGDLYRCQRHGMGDSDICTNVHQFSGRIEQADGSDRMISLQLKFWEIGDTLRAPQHRPVCIQSKQQGAELLQLVHSREREGNICPLTLMETMEQPLLLSSMEFNHSGDSEGQERTSHTDFSDSYVEFNTVIPKPPQTSSDGTCTYAGNGDYSRPQKRKILNNGQKTVVSISLEDRRSSLENQGYNKEAI